MTEKEGKKSMLARLLGVVGISLPLCADLLFLDLFGTTAGIQKLFSSSRYFIVAGVCSIWFTMFGTLLLVWKRHLRSPKMWNTKHNHSPWEELSVLFFPQGGIILYGLTRLSFDSGSFLWRVGVSAVNIGILSAYLVSFVGRRNYMMETADVWWHHLRERRLRRDRQKQSGE
jgi:hypothetical protein